MPVVIKRSTTSYTVVAPKTKLIKVQSEQANFCQVHGSAAGTLYWSGKVMRCLECDKVPAYVREEQMNYDAFSKKLTYLMEKE